MWYSVVWKNWREPLEDQRFSCDELFPPITYDTYKVLEYNHCFLTIVEGTSDIDACDKAGNIFDEYRRAL